jgi:predicted CopG family antitoxin
MRTINIIVEDHEWNKLDKIKGDKNWHDFIMLLINLETKDLEIEHLPKVKKDGSIRKPK